MKILLTGIVLTILLSVCAEAKETKKLTIQEQGYQDGRMAMKNDSKMKITYTDIQKKYNESNDKSERYILIQGHLHGSIKGTCMKLTWGKDKKDKSYAYQKAFESGCWSVYWK